MTFLSQHFALGPLRREPNVDLLDDGERLLPQIYPNTRFQTIQRHRLLFIFEFFPPFSHFDIYLLIFLSIREWWTASGFRGDEAERPQGHK